MREEITVLIRAQAAKIGGLVRRGGDLPIDPLRMAAAELQAYLAEAAHLERVAQREPSTDERTRAEAEAVAT